jgi:hypothetical protein
MRFSTEKLGRLIAIVAKHGGRQTKAVRATAGTVAYAKANEHEISQLVAQADHDAAKIRSTALGLVLLALSIAKDVLEDTDE